MLKLVLRICRELSDIDLHLADIEMKFTRRNYENIQSKAQVLDTMLKNPKIHPQLAYESCGMFSDAEGAYALSMKYYEEQQEKNAERFGAETDEEDDNPASDGEEA